MLKIITTQAVKIPVVYKLGSASIVDENIDTPPLLNRCRRHREAVSILCHISAHNQALNTQRFALGSHRIATLRIRIVIDNHIAALSSQ
jgi:hypothetical protein